MGAEQQVFLDREAREQAASFRHHGYSEPDDFVRRHVSDRLTVKQHRFRRGRKRPGNRA
jgi:hypothetical protein